MPDADEGIHVPYNRDLKKLETLLSGVRRPGDFFVEAAFETPLPHVEIKGVGILSFPVPEAQVRQLIGQASRAPFGRGEATILDESVRKVWQLPPSAVRLGGKTWDKTFARIMSAVADGLGCVEAGITAELHKLLVYDPGGFFAAHRDTEKTPGMFSTMIVVLPCEHTGGELLVRHAGREVSLDLSGTEVSELRVAAFYADCEHEVRPVTGGHRVCLVYNLLQPRAGKGSRPLVAPAYHGEIEKAAATLREAFAGKGAPAKLAWLFKHEYSPAGLSFAGLKGEDAALAKVLRRAAQAADCAVHLGIVHIEENGPAEPDYSDYRGGWYDEEPDEDADFEVVEVTNSEWRIGEWHDTEDHPVDFGEVPLGEGEVLPAGALDGEKPDTQRLTEATGNEGASFERAYHRAALVLWPRDRFADVLLQAGVAAALPYLAERVAGCGGSAGKAAQRKPVLAIARRVLGKWEETAEHRWYSRPEKNPDRAKMLTLLARLGDAALLERFVGGVVTRRFDGSETGALCAAVATGLEPTATGRLLSTLARAKTREVPGAVAGLLGSLRREVGEPPNAEWKKALTEIAAAIVAALPDLKPTPKPAPATPGGDARSRIAHLLSSIAQLKQQPGVDEEEEEESHGGAPVVCPPGTVDTAFVTLLLTSLRALGANALHAKAVSAIAADPAVFDPVIVVVPALTALRPAPAADRPTDGDLTRLWRHAAEFLLARSEEPPAPPADWAQSMALVCRNEDDRELLAFARDPARREHRFRVKKERRQHLHQTIDRLGLDMTHVTERQGSPQTLVCTKTLRTFERQCAQHAADVAAMKALLACPFGASNDEKGQLAVRLKAASQRHPPRSSLKAGR